MKLFILILMSSLLFGSTLVNEYKELRHTVMKNKCLEWVTISKHQKECKKNKEYTLDEINQYINLLKLNDFIKVEGKNNYIIYYNANYTIKRNRIILKNIIKLHNDTVNYSSNSLFRGSSYDILRFLVKYTIHHRDEYLLNALLNGMPSYGNAEYGVYYNEEALFPLLQNFPNIDNYLTDNDIKWCATALFHDWAERSPGTIKNYKIMNKKIEKISLRLYKSLDMYLRGMLLVMNFKITFEEFNRYLYKNNDIKKNHKYFTDLLIKYKLLDELKKYH